MGIIQDDDVVTQTMSIRLGATARRRIRELAEQEHKSKAQILGELVEQGLSREEDISEAVQLRLDALRVNREQDALRVKREQGGRS